METYIGKIDFISSTVGFIAFVLIVTTLAGLTASSPVASAQETFSLAPSNSIPNQAPIKIDSIHVNPVIVRGAPGTWDSVDVLNPSVIRFRDKLLNFYSGFDGKVWRTGVAISKDGIAWEKYSQNPVLEPKSTDWDVRYIAANGSAVVWEGKILYFYQGVDQSGRTHIGLATREGNFQFKKHSSPVLSAGAPNSWESKGVADPYVIAKNGYLYLYYLGQNDRDVQRLGVARSKDGLTWERLPSNPILDVGAAGAFDENGLGEPSIAYQAPYFYLLYTGRDAKEFRNIGYAISTDGVHWKKISATGLIPDTQRASWFSKVICDTTLMPLGGGKWMVWFGGGDKPEPAENLDGQIGLMIIDLGQNRDITGFDANSDWSTSAVKSTDVLRGSYGIEGEAGKRYAWVGPTAYITLYADPSVSGKMLTVEGWAPAELIARSTQQAGPQTIAIIANGKTIAKRSFTKDDPFVLTTPWGEIDPLLADKDTLDLEIKSDRSFVPSRYGDSPDVRDLALIVKRIRFQ